MAQARIDYMTHYHDSPWQTISSLPVLLTSGVATLGHAGARALATRGRAPPAQR